MSHNGWAIIGPFYQNIVQESTHAFYFSLFSPSGTLLYSVAALIMKLKVISSLSNALFDFQDIGMFFVKFNNLKML